MQAGRQAGRRKDTSTVVMLPAIHPLPRFAKLGGTDDTLQWTECGTTTRLQQTQLLNCLTSLLCATLLLLCAAAGVSAQAAGALDKYAVHAVVANLLHTRKDRVLVVKQQQQAGGGPGLHVVEVLRAASEPHIEKQLVAEIVTLHQQFQQQQQQ